MPNVLQDSLDDEIARSNRYFWVDLNIYSLTFEEQQLSFLLTINPEILNNSSSNTDSRTTPTTGQIYPRSKMWKMGKQ